MDVVKYKFELIKMNDGSIPIISFHNSLEEIYNNLSYIQHWMIIDVESNNVIDTSDKGL
jgi:hypothetical protein